MKINKSRLLQIIREEVELHEQNTLELDESFFQETDISKEEGDDIFDQEIQDDEEKGYLDEVEVEEDALFNPKTKQKINHKKNKNDI